ncbi:MAG TPA: ATP-binding protein [Opitutaceae bacterium]|nr:ATP-binding protein [Opitutaceae bacterium]
MEYVRPIVGETISSLDAHPGFIHVIVGPRQVGKTTGAEQISAALKLPSHFAAADLPLPPGPEWIEAQWYAAEAKARETGRNVLLILDEVQKVRGWSEVVKNLWDGQRRKKTAIRLLVLGSSALLLQEGLSESLAGRFLLHRFGHWGWPECREAFGWNLDRWLYFGGYPGAAALAEDEPLWRRYIADSLVDAVLSRDIFQLQKVNKPALMRNLFGIAATFPAQIVSYNKMLGQLHDAGNTTTLAHYLHLLSTAFLASGLELYSAGHRRRRGSSPKLILWNNALINAYSSQSFQAVATDPAWRGRLAENAVGARLLDGLQGPEWTITYWRDGGYEVDFVVQRGRSVFALEVKSGRLGRMSGLARFREAYPSSKPLVIGAGGVPFEEFFAKPPSVWLE